MPYIVTKSTAGFTAQETIDGFENPFDAWGRVLDILEDAEDTAPTEDAESLHRIAWEEVMGNSLKDVGMVTVRLAEPVTYTVTLDA